MEINTSEVLSAVSVLTGVIPLVIGIARRKYFNTGERVLLVLAACSLITDLIASSLRRQGVNNMFVFHIYTVIEFTLISLFYIKTISSKRLVPFIVAIIFLFLVVAAFEFMYKMDQMDEFSTTTEAIIVMLYSILGFSSLLKNPVQSRVMAIPLFWFNTAFLLYFAGNLFLFIFINYIHQHFNGAFNGLWGIHSVMSIIFYLLIATGFWKTKAR